MSLFDSLSKISEQIQSQRHLINSEAATEMVSIRPFIRALGYDIFNLTEVEPQYTAAPHSSGTDRVDYMIKRDGRPIILVEVKSANTSLNQHHWKQLHSYFVALDVEFGILTNGLEYRFYTDLKKRNVMDEEPFLAIDLRNLDRSQISALEGFTKSRYAPDQTVRKIKVSNLLEKELNHPSDDFVKHFAKQVHSGAIWQTVIQEFRPLVKRAWDDLVDQEIARRLRRHNEEEDEENLDSPDADNTKQTEKTSPLPEISAEIPVFLRYKGEILAEDATLTLPQDMQVSFKKVIHVQDRDWTVASSAKAIIHPTTAPAKPSMHGFNYWRVIDPLDDKEYAIQKIWKDEALAARLFEKYASPSS